MKFLILTLTFFLFPVWFSSQTDGWTPPVEVKKGKMKVASYPPLGIEKDTQIEIAGDLAVVGKWRQSRPKDLSQREINWYTWGARASRCSPRR